MSIFGRALPVDGRFWQVRKTTSATLLANMKARGVRYGVESILHRRGMGAAGLFELCE